MVTYSDLWQVLGIFAGIWFAYFSLVISLLVGWYIRDTNRRDKDIDRRFGELEAGIDRRFREMDANIDRRFGELEAGIDRRFREVDANIDRRFGELEADIDRRFREMEEANERRHQELLKAIGALYRHVHADGSPAIVPLPDIDPVAPAPADN
ncbi:MAG: hypothetical protein OXL37_12030 [Chloroflexota bacterium]|nr:hypothetical protein [Chloroflexota bacterium]